jgi:hypothetical protein
MKRIGAVHNLLIISICLLFLSCSTKKEAVDISIARWKGDMPAAFSITSADGLIRSIKSQWTPENPDVPYDGYYKLGKDHNIPITFYIIPRLQDDAAANDFSHSYVSSRTPPALEPGFGGHWEDWKIIHQQGHEIASHTYSHEDFREGPDGKHRTPVNPNLDMAKSIESIEENIGVKPILLNFGLGRPTPEVLEVSRKYYPLHAGDMYRSEHVVNTVFNKHTTTEQLSHFIDSAIVNSKWLIIRAHGLRTELGRAEEAAPDFMENGKRYDGFSPGQYDVLDATFRKLNEMRDSIYIDVFSNVYRYHLEREASNIEVISEDRKKMIIRVTNLLEQEIFSIPLTLKMVGSKGENTPEVYLNGEKLPVSKKGSDFIFEVIPNTGEITIR